MAKAPHYSGPVTKHQELAQTGHAEGYAKGGSVGSSHHSGGGHSTMKHEHHKGFGTHGHKHPHEHHSSPGAGHSGHDGKGVHSLVHHGHGPEEHTMETMSNEIGTDGGGKHDNSGAGGTGGTRNRV